MLMTGVVLDGRYRVGITTGWGGLADVYDAHDTVTGEHVVAKVVPGLTADVMALAVRDAQAIALLHDPAIVSLRSWGMHDATPFIVVEDVHGPTLAELLVLGPLSEDEVAAMGAVLAAALSHGHAIGVTHRDVQPGNVVVTESGEPRLAGFGLALRADPTALLGGQSLAGIHAYLAPEQVRGEVAGPPADVYALGLVLLEALTGERAFVGSPTVAAATRLTEPPIVPDSVSPWLAGLLREMTAVDQSNRPSAATVAAALAARSDVADVPPQVEPVVDVVDLRDGVAPAVTLAAPVVAIGELSAKEERTAIGVAILGIVTIVVITALVFLLV